MNTTSSPTIDIAAITSNAARGIWIALLLKNPDPLSYADLMEVTGTPDRTLRYALDELRLHGIVEVKRAGRMMFVSLQKHATIMTVTSTLEDMRALCLEADESKSREVQIKALQALWKVVFPVKKFAYQQLQPAAAKELLRLAGNSATDIYDMMSQTPAFKSYEGIDWPLGYVKRAILNIRQNQARVDRENTYEELDNTETLDGLRAFMKNQVAAGEMVP